MLFKRKFCDYCKEFVMLRIYRFYVYLYLIRVSEVVYFLEEEEILCDDFEDFYVEYLVFGEVVGVVEVIDG